MNWDLWCRVKPLCRHATGIFSVDALLCKPQQKAEQGLWQWRDDRALWHTYSWIDSKIIEAAYQSGEDELTLTTLGRTYTVDFNSMQQVKWECHDRS